MPYRVTRKLLPRMMPFNSFPEHEQVLLHARLGHSLTVLKQVIGPARTAVQQILPIPRTSQVSTFDDWQLYRRAGAPAAGDTASFDYVYEGLELVR